VEFFELGGIEVGRQRGTLRNLVGEGEPDYDFSRRQEEDCLS